jgi:ketosteroid isomerase-like protein
MSEHPNAVKTRQAYEALNQGDFETYMDLFSKDIVAYVPDISQQGAHVTVRGKAAFFENVRKYDELSGGTMHVEPETILADDAHAMMFLRGTAQRPDKTHDFRFVLAGRLDAEGRWKELWYLADDQRGHEEFWAE